MSPEQVLHLMYGMYGFIAFETLLLVFVFWKTPARLFLMANLRKMAIMLIIGKDNIGYLRPFKPKNGSGYVKGFGLFHLTEDSHILEFGTRMPFYIAFRDVAATVWPQYPAMLQELKEMGYKISTIQDLSDYIEASKQLKDSIKIKVQPFKTYNMAEMKNAFPFNIEPTFIDAEIQTAIAQYMRTIKERQAWMIGLGVFLIIAAIATLIFIKAFKGQIGIEECKSMTTLAVDAARCVQPVVHTITNTTAAIA